MPEKIIIANASVVNEGEIYKADIILENSFIRNIYRKDKNSDNKTSYLTFCKVIDASGLYVIPGVIDDQVHFRDPGLEYKGDIYTESKAAVAGGITSFMEMPNTIPNVLTQELLEEKFEIAKEKSLANFSFYMGASNNNYDELCKTDPRQVCGIKVFMGASTGNMLVDNQEALEKIFSINNILIATHCEDETTIRTNAEHYRNKFKDNVPIEYHPKIRSREACFLSTQKAINLALKHNTRLHVLHLSTEDELCFFSNTIPLSQKRITAEVCIHHLIFNKSNYASCGRLIKWNPAIKNKRDQKALLKSLLNNTIDIVATDHAPHTYEEKQQTYFKSASGGPMVQHALVAMLEMYHQKKISLETIVTKMCHAPAECFRIEKRGFLREGYYADLAIIDINDPWEVAHDNLLYKCKWSPLTGEKFTSRITHTIVNGNIVYDRGLFDESHRGQRLKFNPLQ
ncbi:MAG: dihydroorotase [Bacteroidales bacterium]|nr:dihydroorotase [Bacteroidales bacterium]